jgi:glycerol-3-phosphate O-acyltransferase/dihydroxyacetone phosphate acyltransferase
MLYRFFKFIMHYAVRTYFREIQLLNIELIPTDGPLIFLPNHRSAFMDPLIIASYSKRQVHFLARGESFKKPLMAKFLGKLNVIPIYRKEHTPDDMHKNEETFEYCYRILEKNGVLVIFPEGASQSKPILLPLKTGTARIALGAENKNNFTLGVKLLPVGINYTNPHHFQGKLFLNYGKPINTSDYKSDYLNDPVATVKSLTAHIESELKKRVVIVDDSRWFDLTEKVDQIIQSDSSLFGVNKENEPIKWFMAQKDIAQTIAFFRKEKIELLEGIELRVQQYFSIVELLNVKDGFLNPLGKNKANKSDKLSPLIYFALGLPIFIIGLILHILPFYLTNFIAKKVVKKSDFIGSIILVLGLVLFTINGLILTRLVFLLSHSLLFTLLFFFILPTLGIFAFQYYIRIKRAWSGVRMNFIGRRKKQLMVKLKEEKEDLLRLFKSAHLEYLNKELEIKNPLI